MEPKHEEDEEHEEELCDEEDNIENIIPQTKPKKRKVSLINLFTVQTFIKVQH